MTPGNPRGPVEARPAALALLAGLALLPGAAWSQTEPQALQMPELSVQGTAQTPTGPVRGFVAERSLGATKTDTSVLETPQAVSVVTRDRMEAQAIRNVEEALRYVPGVTSELNGQDSRFDSARIRGFDARPSQYLDGLRMLRQFGPTTVEPYGLERLEVIRGPSSVLYGQTVPGGLVNMVSKRPTATPFGEINLSAGSFDRYQAGFDLGGPLTADGRFQYRLTGMLRNSGTQVDHVGDDRYFIAPALTWRPSDDTRLTLLGRFQYDQGSSPIGLPASGTLLPNRNGTIPRNRFAGEPDYNRSDINTTSVGWDLEHRFNQVWSVRQNARYMNNNVNYDTLYGSSLAADGRTMNRGSLVQREGSNTVNIDTTVQARFATGPVSHTVLAGFDYRQYWGNYQTYFGTAPSIDIFNPGYGRFVPDSRSTATIRTNRDDRMSQFGLYAQEQLRYGGWLLTLGGRQDWATTDASSRIGAASTGSDDSAFTGRAALMYLFDNGIAPYVSYATSFDPVTGATAAQRGAQPFRPTEGEQLELGVKFQPRGSNSFFTAALFDLTQSNVSTRDPIYAGASVQTGEIRVRGVELEAVASLSRGLNLIASYTYLDGEITRANDGTRGNRPALVPMHSAGIWADYRFGEGSRLAGFGLGGGVRYRSSIYGDNANTLRSPGVTLVDASISYDVGKYRVALNASNLFDENYVASCQGTMYCYYGTGRTVIGNVTYRW